MYAKEYAFKLTNRSSQSYNENRFETGFKKDPDKREQKSILKKMPNSKRGGVR